MRLLCLCCCVKAEGQGNSVEGSIVKCGYCVCAAMCRLKMKATVLKDPTATDTLANLIPASKAEEALVKKAGSKVNLNAAVPLHIMPCPAPPSPALPCPPRPALPCPALPCPALPCLWSPSIMPDYFLP